jgi:TolB-like protein
MKEEEFADGLTEEIIDKLSKVPGIRVPAATASFYFKNKKIPVAEIARTLGVVYVLDGSTRQSSNSVRIAARLVRAENGYVIWSETYDRPFVDRVAVQDEIAGELTKALRASIEGTPNADQPPR